MPDQQRGVPQTENPSQESDIHLKEATMNQAANTTPSTYYATPVPSELRLAHRLGFDAFHVGRDSERSADRMEKEKAKEDLLSYLKVNGYNPLAQWNCFNAIFGGVTQTGRYTFSKSVEVDEFSGEIHRIGYPGTTTIKNLITLLEDELQVPLQGLTGSFLERRLEPWLEARTFNPVQRYLGSLVGSEPVEPWGGWGTLARDVFSLEDETSQVLLTSWILGAVQRAMDPGSHWRQVLILQGEQEAGKGQFLQQLFGESFYTSRDSEMSDEHVKRVIADTWVVELEEMEAVLNKRSDENLKRWIATPFDDLKINHKEQTKRNYRRCVIAASVNSTEFLRDDSGHSRYWILPGIKAVNVDYVIANRDNIWREAYRRYQEGERGWSKEKTKLSEARAKDYEVSNPWLDPLQDVIDSLRDHRERGDIQIVTRTSDLLTALGLKTTEHRRHTKLVASALGTLGYEQKNTRVEGKRARYWFSPDGDRPCRFYVKPDGEHKFSFIDD